MDITPGNTNMTPFQGVPANHIVEYYDDEERLAYKLFDFIYEGLMKGETCIVVTRPALLIALQKMLRNAQVDIVSLLSNERYAAYDAEEILGRCIRQSQLNRDL